MSNTTIDTATTPNSRVVASETKNVARQAASKPQANEVNNRKVGSSPEAAQAEKVKQEQQREKIYEAIERASRLDPRLSFQVDEQSGKFVVVVRDAQTSEILKQFPSEEMLNIAHRLEEYINKAGDSAGLLHADEA